MCDTCQNMISTDVEFDGFHKKNWTEVGYRDLIVFFAYHKEPSVSFQTIGN